MLLREDENKGASNSDFKTKLEYYDKQDDNIKLEQQKKLLITILIKKLRN
ncbi:hypothetical protein [Brachyspira hyodysenteriae]|nr:hypothetical protein [Brachyspira hyodysenteriae]MCZ9885432.1 hypothetical protein [Brachyspira hyodysenteriae]